MRINNTDDAVIACFLDNRVAFKKDTAVLLYDLLVFTTPSNEKGETESFT